MKRLTALATVAALVLGSAAVFAQAKPNFAGKWTLDPASAPAPGGGGGRGGRGGGGLGQDLTIAQDATTLTLDYVGGGPQPRAGQADLQPRRLGEQEHGHGR